MIAKIRRILTKKSINVEYFWAGYGSNPLKDLGIKDFSDKQRR